MYLVASILESAISDTNPSNHEYIYIYGVPTKYHELCLEGIKVVE